MSRETQNQPSRDLLRSELGPSFESQVAWYHHMQETQPIRYRPEYYLWEVFRYKDVQQVLLDYATFSVEKSRPENFPSVLGLSVRKRRKDQSYHLTEAEIMNEVALEALVSFLKRRF